MLSDGESAIYAYKCTNLRMNGFACFCGSDSLVVGNGTTHSNSRIAGPYFRIDRPGQMEYLTAGWGQGGSRLLLTSLQILLFIV